MKTKNKGITLIALVITIIILLILAGVAIGKLTGNGLFDKVKLAKEESEQKQQEENAILGDYEEKINNYVDSSRDTVTIPKEEYDKLKNANTYTEDEVQIGTWTNGKPIFRKIIELQSLGRAQEIEIATVDKIDCLIKSYGFSNGETIGATLPGMSTYIYKNGTKIYAYQNGDIYSNKPITIVLEYTKITE